MQSWRLVCSQVFLASALAAQTGRNNLLVILADDLGVDSVNCFNQGANPPPTPVLDQLAATGMRFTRAYAHPSCSPTRASLVTGRHGFRTGIRRTIMPGEPGLPMSEAILPEIVSAAQIPCALVGKWHLGTHSGDATPNRMGWQHFSGVLDYGVDNYFDWQETRNGQTARQTAYATTRTVDESLAWVQAQTQPWMLMVSFVAPHGPFHAPPAHLHSQSLAGLNPATTPVPFYKAMVQAMDAEIGRLLAGLGNRRSTTNIIFLGDNGTPGEVSEAPFPSNRAKGTLYQAGSNVPLIVAGPIVSNPGSSSSALVSVVDLLPTALSLLALPPVSGLPYILQIDGVDFASVLRGTAASVRSSAFSDVLATGLGEGMALRGPRHELLRFTGNGIYPHEEFYDLVTDPHEQNDLLRGPLSAAAQAAFDQLHAEFGTMFPGSWVEGFGSGCSDPLVVPVLLPRNTPRLGTNFVYDVLGVPGSDTRLGIVGSSRTSHLGLPLPYDLGAAGAPGCAILSSPESLVYVATASIPWSIPIPAKPRLAGSVFFNQLLVLRASANPLGLLTSSGRACTVGF